MLWQLGLVVVQLESQRLLREVVYCKVRQESEYTHIGGNNALIFYCLVIG